MQSFKQFLLENENTLNFVKKQYPKIDTSHDSLASHRDSASIVDHFSKHADPSPKKKYSEWITREYSKGKFRQEDHGRIKNLLTTFQNHHQKTGSKNILDHSYEHLTKTLDPHLPKEGPSNKEIKRMKKSDGAEEIHNDEHYSIHRLKTKEGACAYGAGTKWCTAAKQNNQFDNYNKDGPLHVFHDKKSGEKYQFHQGSNQYMDSKDIPVDTHALTKKHPILQKHFGHDLNFKPNATSKDIENALNSKNEMVRRSAVLHPNLSSKHIDRVLKVGNRAERYLAMQHANATKEHISKGLRDSDSSVRVKAMDHPDATEEHITTGLSDSDTTVRLIAIQHPNVNSKHITKALNDKHSTIRMNALQNPAVTARHIAKGLKDSHEQVRSAAGYAAKTKGK